MIKKLFLLFTLLISLSINVYADVVDTILERGTLKVGFSLFEPWTMQDKSGQLSGFEIDVATKIAQDMGVKPEFILYKWENIITALRKGEIDIIASGMAITPERALKLSFSQPYSEFGLTLATNIKLTKDITDFDQLNQADVIFSVVSGTVSYDLVKRIFDKAKINAAPTSGEASQAVIDGKAHAYVSDSPQPEFLALRNPDKVDMPLSNPLISFQSGFGVNKGEQEWLNFLNSWITARTADKWLPTTHKHWFKTLDWQHEAE